MQYIAKLSWFFIVDVDIQIVHILLIIFSTIVSCFFPDSHSVNILFSYCLLFLKIVFNKGSLFFSANRVPLSNLHPGLQVMKDERSFFTDLLNRWSWCKCECLYGKIWSFQVLKGGNVSHQRTMIYDYKLQ